MSEKTIKEVGICTVGDKGQIVIPAKIRKLFNINAGDSLVILADTKKGIALLKAETIQPIVEGTLEK